MPIQNDDTAYRDSTILQGGLLVFVWCVALYEFCAGLFLVWLGLFLESPVYLLVLWGVAAMLVGCVLFTTMTRSHWYARLPLVHPE
jgi:hypothetical protein